MRSIVVMIDKQGGTTVEAMGYESGECATATRPLEEALGVVVSRDYKPEYHAVPVSAEATVEEF